MIGNGSTEVERPPLNQVRILPGAGYFSSPSTFPENLNFCQISAPRNISNGNDLVNLAYDGNRQTVARAASFRAHIHLCNIRCKMI